MSLLGGGHGLGGGPSLPGSLGHSKASPAPSRLTRHFDSPVVPAPTRRAARENTGGPFHMTSGDNG